MSHCNITKVSRTLPVPQLQPSLTFSSTLCSHYHMFRALKETLEENTLKFDEGTQRGVLESARSLGVVSKRCRLHRKMSPPKCIGGCSINYF